MLESADEVFEYLGSFVNFERKQKQTIREYRLDRMRLLLSFFGDPQNEMHIIHIAGSKGKGSTALYLAKGLSALGEKTGLYSSPHVSNYRERITSAGSFFDDALYLQEGRRIAEKLPEFSKEVLYQDAEPTAFELLTLLAFLVFRAAGCSIAVIETGIGGRLDATNVIQPVATVLTPIEREHTDVLGDTIPQIASEKAGIMKAGIPTFASQQRFPEAYEVFKQKAEEVNSRLYFLPDYIEDLHTDITRKGSRVQCRIGREGDAPVFGLPRQLDFRLAMLGEFQAQNALLAILVLGSLMERGLIAGGAGDGLAGTDSESGINPRLAAGGATSDAAGGLKRGPDKAAGWEKVLQSISAARLPGRLELCSRNPVVVLDGAHTPVSIQYTIDTFSRAFGTGGVCIFGAVEGKDIHGMASELSRHFQDIIVSKPGSFKPNDPAEVHKIFLEYQNKSHFEPDPRRALDLALETAGTGRPILVCGSFYMVSEIRPLLQTAGRDSRAEVE